MEWKEVKIYTTTEGIEPVSAMLLETGVTGIQVEDDRELKEYLNTSSEFWDYVDEELLNKPIGETKVTVYVSENPYGHHGPGHRRGGDPHCGAVQGAGPPGAPGCHCVQRRRLCPGDRRRRHPAL